jgi:hypothetical protein
MSIGPLPPIIDAASDARLADSNARAATASQIAGPGGEKSITDDSADDGRRPWERPTPDKETLPVKLPVSSGSVDPTSGSQLDIMA